MALLEGLRCPEKRGDRERLSARSPQVEVLVRGLNLDAQHIAVARRTGNTLWRWRNDFDVRRRRGGMFVPNRLLDKGEADRLLKLQLAALAGGEQ